MARSDLLLSLVKAGTSGDRKLFRTTVEAIIAEERSRKHSVLADRLTKQLEVNGHTGTNGSSNGISFSGDFFHEISPHRSLTDMVLPEHVLHACLELIEEQHRADLLRSHNIQPRHRILLSGAPGNGKTTLAEALAESLWCPCWWPVTTV